MVSGEARAGSTPRVSGGPRGGRLLLRGLLLEAPFNPVGQQRGGLAWILHPAKPPDPEAPFNAQPALAGYLTGWWESGQREFWSERRAGVAAALGALGDRLVWGLLRPFAILLALLASAIGPPGVAAGLLLVGYNAAEVALRWRCVRVGLRGPGAVLRDLEREGLPRLARPLARSNALLVGVLGGFWFGGLLHDGGAWPAVLAAVGGAGALRAVRGGRNGPWRDAALALALAALWIGIAAIR